MNSIIRKEYNSLYETYIISLTFLLYLYRVTIPLLKFPFLIFYIYLGIHVFYNHKRRISESLIEFVRNFYPFLVLAALMVISFFWSNKLYLSIFKDIINSAILLSFFAILSIIIKTKTELVILIKSLINSFIIFALVLSIYRLSSLFSIFSTSGSSGFLTPGFENYTIPIDYNFAALHIFLGMIGVISFLINDISTLKKFVYSILLTIYSISIIFTGSRRGAFVLLGIISVLVIVQFFTLLKNGHFVKRLALNARCFLSILFILLFSCYIFSKTTSFQTKDKVLKFVGSKNIPSTKEAIAIVIWRYNTIFKQKKSYFEVYNNIWTPVFVPEDPDSGWGSQLHKTIYPLVGEHVEIVPSDAKGYLLDNKTCSVYANGSAFSVTWLSNQIVDDEQILSASVFCYVSKDCDLTTVNICSLGAMGNPGANYNFQGKGSWQKLSFEVGCRKGEASILLYIAKNGKDDFSSLNGYVMFAYPQFQVTNCKISIDKSIEKILPFNYTASINYPMKFERNGMRTLFIINKPQSINKHKCKNEFKLQPNEAGLFIFNNKISQFAFFIQDKDPIRELAARLIFEDTTYYGYTKDLHVGTVANDFLGSRLLRWQFAVNIFLKEYNLRQKLFGGGFNFLNWYGFYFLNDKTLSDYPHNPFLSILLYSGIFGLCLYLVLIFKVFSIKFIFFKEFYIIYFYFIITFFFSFFSAGSPFDPPIMGFFMLLLFFVRSIY